MAPTRDLANRVTRTEEEHDALYDMQIRTHGWVKKIARVQRTHGQQLDSIQEVQASHTELHASHNEKLDEILRALGKAP